MARPCRHLLAPGQVAMKHPSAVTACNLDLENLVTDANRSIATLAITTLLKTGSEGSIDRLMKQISSFMSEISDEFKVHRLRLLRGGPGLPRGLAVAPCEALLPASVGEAGGSRPVKPFVVSRVRAVLCWAKSGGASRAARTPACPRSSLSGAGPRELTPEWTGSSPMLVQRGDPQGGSSRGSRLGGPGKGQPGRVCACPEL